MGGATFRAGPVTLRIGDPISTEGLTPRDRQALTQRVREQIVNLQEASLEATPSGLSG